MRLYLNECKNSKFKLSVGPFWVSIDDQFELVIEAPNQVAVVGFHTLIISIWEVTLHVRAPCKSTILEGLSDENSIKVYLDQLVQVKAKFKDDKRHQSWEVTCGKLQQI